MHGFLSTKNLSFAGFGPENKKILKAVLAIAGHPQLAGIWSHDGSDQAFTKTFEREFGIPLPPLYKGIQEYDDFIKELDFLSIAVPPAKNLNLMTLALVNNPKVNILVQKPVAHQLHHLESCHIPDDGLKRVAVGCQLGFHYGFRIFAEAVLQTDQKIVKVEINMLKNALTQPGITRSDYKLYGGGIWMDLGPHVLDMLERLGFWSIVKVISGGTEIEPHHLHKPEVEQKAEMILETKDGVIVDICLSNIEEYLTKPQNNLLVYDRNGFINDYRHAVHWLDFSEAKWVVDGREGPRSVPRELMMVDFFSGAKRCTKISSAYAHQQVIDAGYRSAKNCCQIIL